EGGITPPRILDCLAKCQDIRIKRGFVHSGNTVLLPRVSTARLGPSFAFRRGSAEFGKNPSDFPILIAYGHLLDHVNVLCRGRVLDRSRQGLSHRHRGMTAPLPVDDEG